MYAKTNRGQTLWVLLTSLLLILLFTGGLWVYIQQADAETGIQETNAMQIPEADKTVYVQEKYDNFPVGDVDLDKEFNRVQGSGLSGEELSRLNKLLEEYAAGKRPAAKAPSLPGSEAFAIIPLVPESYGGQTEYYILPQSVLSDEQLLMLIDYSAQKGETFSIETTNWKNCMREGFPGSNRYLSAGETLRRNNLHNRIKTEGFRPASSELTEDKLPVSGVGSIRLNKRENRNSDSFHLYPLRELTDEELMQTLYLDYLDGFEYIPPSTDDRLDPVADTQRMRAIFEEITDMPASAASTELTYRRKIDTGEIHMHTEFASALVNGVETFYYAIEKMSTGEILYLSRDKIDTNISNANYVTYLPNSDISFAAEHWKEIAREAISKLTPMKITEVLGNGVMGTQNGQHLEVDVTVYLEDGSGYYVFISVADDRVSSAQFIHHDVELINDYIW